MQMEEKNIVQVADGQDRENLKHDQTYKLFFSDPELVWALVQHHLDLPDKDKLLRNSLSPCQTEYVLETLNRSISDMAWELAWEDGRILRFFIVLEFQSYPLKYMAIRSLLHKTMIWDRMIANKETGKDQKLPLVVDVVLHNGPNAWTMSTRVRDLVEPVSPELERHIPDCEYLVIDMRHIPTEDLGNDPVSYLIRLEQAKTVREIIFLIKDMVKNLASPTYANAKRNFGKWIKNIGIKRAGIKEIPASLKNLEDDEMIFCEQAERLFDEYWGEARQEGKQEERHYIAMNMYRKNYTIEAISEITGLTELQIKELVHKSGTEH